jgi:hypothetical protein
MKALARLGYTGIGLSYATLALATIRLLLGAGDGGKSSDRTTRDWTARLLDKPLEALLMIAAVLVVLAIVYDQHYQAYTVDFQRHLHLAALTTRARQVVISLGRYGLAALGAVFTVAGLFLIVAALHHNPDETRE